MEEWYEEGSYLISFSVAYIDLLVCSNFLSTMKWEYN